jgi:SanA protein
MLFHLTLILCAVTMLLVVMARVATESYLRSRLFSKSDVPPGRVAIVFGAGLTRNGYPSPVLQDRVTTAADLYFSGKVKKILMSGDNRFIEYNEPGAMLKFALELGVPREDIVLDYAGRRTYDTCYRAKYIFGVEEAILVTQRFHLPRAVYTCSMMGIKSTGVVADLHRYAGRSLVYWNMRETAALVVAFWDIWISHPLPVLGIPEPIFPIGEEGKTTKSLDLGTDIAQK